MEHEIAKALEIWTLQNMLDASIMAGFIALGFAAIGSYHRKIERSLTLRVSIEIWRVVTVLFVDILLAFMVVAGLLLINPDIMADIKMAVPFYPISIVLVAIVLVRRLVGRHSEAGGNDRAALWLLFWANMINLVGFTFIMEAPGSEYLELHPSPTWTWLKTHLLSNALPAGLETGLLSFWIFFPALLVILLWAFRRAMSTLESTENVD